MFERLKFIADMINGNQDEDVTRHPLEDITEKCNDCIAEDLPGTRCESVPGTCPYNLENGFTRSEN